MYGTYGASDNHIPLNKRFSKREGEIISLIAGSDVPLSPYDLNKNLDCSYATIFRDCKKLEENGILISDMTEGTKKTRKKTYELSYNGFLSFIWLCFGFLKEPGKHFNFNADHNVVLKIQAIIEKYRHLNHYFDYYIFLTNRIPSEKLQFLCVNQYFLIKACLNDSTDEGDLFNDLVLKPLKIKTWENNYFDKIPLEYSAGYSEWLLDFYISTIREYSNEMYSTVCNRYKREFNEIENKIIMLRKLFPGEVFSNWIKGMESQGYFLSLEEESNHINSIKQSI